MSVQQMIADLQVESLPNIPPEILQTMMPATCVMRADGTIAAGFVHEDYTQRMEPADIIQSLEFNPEEGVS